jgi:uncharacterized delta-60 repeat protein
MTRTGLTRITAASGALLALFVATAAGAVTDRDLSFGTAGIVTTDLGADGAAHAVVVQPDGKIVVAGGRNTGTRFDPDDWALTRYDARGALDPTFGDGGRVIADLGTDSENVTAAAVGPGETILVAGHSRPHAVLGRFRADGTLDPGFGSGGVVRTDFGAVGLQFDLVVQPDGRIVVAGDSNGRVALARFLPDGAPDPTFGDGGKSVTGWPDLFASPRSVALQPDGKIVVAGSAGCFPCRGLLLRYGTNGHLDETFGEAGRVLTSFGGDYDSWNDVAVQPDGKIVTTGLGARESGRVSDGFALARHTANGSLDATFGTGGTAIVLRTGALDGPAMPYALTVQPDGRIVVAGGVWRYPSRSNFAVVRLLADGTPDPTFSGDGLAEDGTANQHDFLTALALDPDGRIVAAGSSGTIFFDRQTSLRDFAVVRYLPNGEETVPPDTALVDGVAEGSVTASRDAIFHFVGSDNADSPNQLRFTCSLDGAPFAACTSPHAFAGLSDGVHSFAVRATDRSGNVDPTPATRTWTIDATPPDTALTAAPPALTSERGATVSFTGSDALTAAADVRFECSLDGAAFASCTSPHTLAGLADGRHSFAVRALDAAGNRDATPAVHEWTVDATPPARPRVTGPRRTASLRPTLRLSSSDAHTARAALRFLCAVGSRPPTSCAPAYRPKLRAGRNVVRVAAVDEAGNRSPFASFQIVVKRTTVKRMAG